LGHRDAHCIASDLVLDHRHLKGDVFGPPLAELKTGGLRIGTSCTCGYTRLHPAHGHVSVSSEISIQRLAESRGIELKKKRGGILAGKCPFHASRTDTLVIDPKANVLRYATELLKQG
jgi:hypothetical protein